MVCRIVGGLTFPVASAGLSWMAGTSGGGCGGSTPRNVCRNHLPRVTGDVRAAAEVTVSNVPLRGPELSRQPLVDERVVRGQQIEHAAILVHDAVEEQLRLPLECVPQV